MNAVPDPIILPVTFNDDNNVDAPETNKLVKLFYLITMLMYYLNYQLIKLN